MDVIKQNKLYIYANSKINSAKKDIVSDNVIADDKKTSLIILFPIINFFIFYFFFSIISCTINFTANINVKFYSAPSTNSLC